MIVGLPIEIKVREYLSKTLLAFKILEKTNHEVIIGEKNKVYRVFKNNKNIYLISKGGPLKLFKFYKKKYSKNYLGILDEEGPLSNIGKFDLKPRIEKNIFHNLNDYFVWGKKDKVLLKKNNKKKFSHLYKDYGHPKFDLLEKPNIKIFDNEVKKINKIYDNLIFIPSSFSWDTVLGEKNFVNHLVRYHSSTEKTTSENYMSNLQLEKKNYELFLQLLIDLAKNNPKYNFVFRPHPRQSIKFIKKRIPNRIKNLHIIYQYTVTPWIIASKLYIHYGCTSSLEASYLRKKIIFYVENEKAFQTRNINLYKSLGYYFNDFNKCYEFIDKNLKDNLKFVKKSSFPKNLIYNNNNNKFSDLFVDLLNTKYRNKLINISYKEIKEKFNKNRGGFLRLMLSKIKEILLKNFYLSNFLRSVFPVLNLTKEYKVKKFDELPYKELNKTFLLLKSKINSKISIKINQLDTNLFHIKKIK